MRIVMIVLLSFIFMIAGATGAADKITDCPPQDTYSFIWTPFGLIPFMIEKGGFNQENENSVWYKSREEMQESLFGPNKPELEPEPNPELKQEDLELKQEETGNKGV